MGMKEQVALEGAGPGVSPEQAPGLGQPPTFSLAQPALLFRRVGIK